MSHKTSFETASYAGGVASIASSLTLTEWGVIIGIATALLTFMLNLVYVYRKDKRARVESEVFLEAMRHGIEVTKLRGHSE